MPIQLGAPSNEETLYWRDLTTEEKERYYPTEDDEQAKHYFRFNNRPYYLPAFTRVDLEANPEFDGYDGAYAHSGYYTGVLFRMGEEDNVIATNYSSN